MSESKIQNFENHAKVVPAFHFVVLPIFLINLIWSIFRLAHVFSAGNVISTLVAVAFILLALNARMFALTVQDRVIRLEMRLRLQQVSPENLLFLRRFHTSLRATRHQNACPPSRSIFAVASPIPLVPPMITARFSPYRSMRSFLRQDCLISFELRFSKVRKIVWTTT
jgi:hypothetical protein